MDGTLVHSRMMLIQIEAQFSIANPTYRRVYGKWEETGEPMDTRRTYETQAETAVLAD